MKKLLFILFWFSFLTFHSQENKFCQFIMSNIEKREKAIEIDQFIRNQEGVVISRTDIVSKKYLIIYNSKSSINLLAILNWMDTFNVDVKCIREGIHGVDAIIDQKFNCE
jgi:hypothetical protein